MGGASSALTAEQLMNIRGTLLLEDQERSVAQRILGLFSFVNMIWLVSIFGVLLTVGPCLIFLFGSAIAKLLRHVYEYVLVPMHKIGAFELSAWVLAFLLSAQSCRYPAQHAAGATLVGLTGALAFGPCWLYSTVLWAGKTSGRQEEFATLSSALLGLSLLPLAIIHASSLIGFFTVCALYAACGFFLGPFVGGFVIGFHGLDAVLRCLLVSALLIAIFTTLHVANVSAPLAAPFHLGAMVLGNVVYFLALLLLSSKFRHPGPLTYEVWNALMLGSIGVAAAVGSVFALPSCVNTAATFFVLWVMEKEMEVRWGEWMVVVLFFNFIALYYLAHQLHTHPEIITSLFDPAGLYV